MSMNFFNFAAEIRLMIYEELLVLSEPITFETTWDPSRPLSLSKRYGLCPALLRANKRVNREASPLLYSGNRFRFSGLDLTPSFLRHVCIDFPEFGDYRPGSTVLQEDSIKILELIRDNCTGIATLETSLRDDFRLECVGYKLDSSPITVEALELLDARFKAILSLKVVIVDAHVYDDEDLSDDLMKKMRDCGWTIKVAKLEKLEYVDSEYYLDMEEEEDEEDEEWEDEYYRRRYDFHWKNDSDFD
ncbi:MAG: hypothetical protein M1813_008767 [Trichoglossum hirsutum]|nr:MAG: hypothetical protein M1813_008767 [Trichoglossum hirsutum]